MWLVPHLRRAAAGMTGHRGQALCQRQRAGSHETVCAPEARGHDDHQARGQLDGKAAAVGDHDRLGTCRHEEEGQQNVCGEAFIARLGWLKARECRAELHGAWVL